MSAHQRDPHALHIAGVENSSAIDWPGKIATVVFLQGCAWRCGYCHSYDIRDETKPGVVAWASVLEQLETDRSVLDAVVFTGGEPLLQPAIITAARQVKELGLDVGIHTSGAYPNVFTQLLPYVDWVGLDIKAPSRKYRAITLIADDDAAPMECLRKAITAGVDVQVRTTLDPLVLDEEDVLEIQHTVSELGVTDFVLQRVRLDGTDPEYARALTQYRAKCAHVAADIVPLG